MRLVTVYRRKSRYFVNASSLTTAGVWIASGPCHAADDTIGNAELAAAIAQTFTHSVSNVPHPQSFGHLSAPLLDAAKVKSWRTFASAASCVDLEEREGDVLAIPMKRIERESSFQRQEERSVRVRLSELERLGAVVKSLFD
jgi:hypothetical protein